MINVPKYDDLLKIEEFLRENELDSGNLSVVIYIQTQERLNRINKIIIIKPIRKVKARWIRTLIT